MSQGFNLRFDKMRENNPAANQDTRPDNMDPERFDGPGGTRNVCFVWPDGKRMFFNYAYLVAAEFNPKEDMNEIKLEFSSHTVCLRGYGLEGLFMEFLDHVPRVLTGIDPRYTTNPKSCNTSVIEITVKSNQD